MAGNPLDEGHAGNKTSERTQKRLAASFESHVTAFVGRRRAIFLQSQCADCITRRLASIIDICTY